MRVLYSVRGPGQFKANPLIIGRGGDDGGRMHRKIMLEDTFTDTLAELQDKDWAFMSACTYSAAQTAPSGRASSTRSCST